MNSIKLPIYIGINKALMLTLMLTLMLAIVATGAFAIHLTHVQASLMVTFGEPVKTQVAMADVINTSALQEMPLPGHKPAQGVR